MKQPHAMDIETILKALETSETGLSQAEAARRLTENGANELEEAKPKSIFALLAAQFSGIMIWILLIAAGLSILLHEWLDAGIILFVVVINAVLGALQEYRAEAALGALKRLAAPHANVLRDGAPARIKASELVTGDIVLLEAGDAVPADVRLLHVASLKVEESSLTGESVPVDKFVHPALDAGIALGERINMAYMGTTVTFGRATGVIAAIGMDTQIGQIARQLAHEEKEITPLQKKLNGMSKNLSFGVLGAVALIFAIGMLGGHALFDMFLISVSLAVAAIPEGLVAIVTILLALGMNRMAARGSIVRRLPAVETLGSTQVICSDKTGTLTQNRMTVQRCVAQDSALLYAAMAHCNDAVLDNASMAMGDPTETALIDHLLLHSLASEQSIRARKRVAEIPFDSERKRSCVAVATQHGIRVFVKGAPDVLIGRCIDSAEVKALALAANDEMAQNALRVLAFAYKDVEAFDACDIEASESDLRYIGLVGMMDPPRPEVKDAIATCRRAGILPIMITGDHKTTALAIAQQLDMLNGRSAITGAELSKMNDAQFDAALEHIGVYARVAPEHKTRIIHAWKKRGRIVAMTGDGVNDAPALRASDIGVGMGITGTDVSKGASDMILADDNFATIVSAVGEGRRIFDNIHKTVRFLLSCNAGEVLAILAAVIVGWDLLRPVHILWINLVTDTLPALALGVEPAEPDIMLRPPRDSQAPFFSGKEWFNIVGVGFVEAFLTICAYAIGSFGYGSPLVGSTMAFLTLSLTQLFAALAFQSERASIFTIRPAHRTLFLAFAASACLVLITLVISPLRKLFALAELSLLQFVIAFILAGMLLFYIELQKIYIIRNK